MDRGGWLPLFLVCLTWFALTITAQQCALTFYMLGNQEDRVVFTGLTAEELARSGGTTTTGDKLTCACATVEGLAPLLWLDESGVALPDSDKKQLVDYKVADKQPGSAVKLRINKGGFSCAEAGEYTCVVGNNNRSVLVTPIGVECGPANVSVRASPTGPVSIGTDLTLQCSAEDPTASGLTYQWLRKGTLISGELSPTLMVTVMGPQEGGTYTCRVRNRVGQASVTVDMIIIPDVASSTPVVTPNTPVITPSTSVIASSPSDVAPSTPVITPSTSVIASSPSDVAPSTPVITPSTSVITSSPSDVAPITPVITHSTSVITHSTPVMAQSTSVFASTSSDVAPRTSVIASTSFLADSTTAVVTPFSTTASIRPSTSPTPSPTVDPQTPTGVSVSTPRVTNGAVQIALMWSKPGNDSGLTGYQIQYSWESKWDPSRFVKRQSEPKTMSVTVSATDTSYTLQDAEGFAEYCFEVSALYEGGEESPATDEECTTTPKTKPSPPLNLRQVDTSVTTSSVRLQWDAPDRPNGNIKHFKVYYQQGSSRQYQVSDWQVQGYLVLDGLDPNTEYYVNVTAVTDTFESDTSNGLRVTTLPVATFPDRGVGMFSDSGEVIVTIVTALLLLVFTNAVSVVVTFLCTRRCYRKKTSSPGPPPPEEKCDHYEAVELDNVQMQICPAYASVDKAKSS